MKLSNLFLCSLLVAISQGCDDDKASEKRGGIGYEDAALRDASDQPDTSTGELKDAGEADAAKGTAGASGPSGEHAAAGGNAAGSGGMSGRGVTGEAGAKAAGAGGKAGGAGKGGAAGSAGASGAKEPAAGSGGMSTPAAGAGGNSTGVAGATAGAGGAAGTNAQAGAGGAAGTAEAGSGAAAGSGGDGGASIGERCGTRGGVTCDDGEFCNFEPDRDCGGTDRGGLCEDKPEICNDLYQPVCGCDNRTHANVCYTHRDGASVKHEGLCTAEECDAAGGHVARSDGANTPTCSQGELSWSIASGGDEPAVCCLSDQPSGRTCAGIAGLDCEEREFCNFETEAGGQGCDGRVADAAGMCQALPVGCTREYNPVCGCDKKSYDNACVAHSFGTSIFHLGACTELDCAAVAGRVVYGSGPAPMCAPGEVEWTDNIVNSSGSMAIEGAICCRSE